MSINSTLGEVEEILDRRGEGNNIEYLVRWKRSEHKDDDSIDESNEEWVPAAMCNCPTAIAIYEKAQGLWKEEYDVEGIVESIKHPNGNVEYLVKWKGYDVTENTWVKEKNMVNCDEIIAEFDEGRRYRKNMLKVKSIKNFEGLWDGVEHYTIVKMGEKEEEGTDKLYSIDELYVAVNGRKSLIRYHGKFL